MKYARNVVFQIKKGKDAEFDKTFREEVLPLLRKQEGFKEELTFMAGDGRMAISLWNDRTTADKYAQTTYPQVLKMLEPMIDGAPKIALYEVGTTTLQL